MRSDYTTKKVGTSYLSSNTELTNFYSGLGYITVDLLREILKELDEKMTPSDLEQMIEEIDTDKSGTVDWEGISQ